MTDHERIERQLHDAAAEIRVGTSVSSELRRRIRLRRLGTVTTGLVVAACLVFGASFAAGALTSDRARLGPAQETSDLLIEYRRSGGFEGSDARLTVDPRGSSVLHYTQGTDGITVEGVLPRPMLTGLEEAIAALDWPAIDGVHDLASGVGVADGYEYELKHDGYVVTTISGAEPQQIKPLIELLDALIAYQRAQQEPSKPAGCGRVGFEPTYLPEGWLPELQEGGGDGEDPFDNIAGHYGAEDSGSEDEKIDAGFINVHAFGFRFEPPSDGDLIVLGQPAEFDEENGTIAFGSDGCAFSLVGAGVGREKLVPFAEGLRPRSQEGESSEPEHFGAVWPTDNWGQVRATCTSGSFSEPLGVTRRFGQEVLEWEGSDPREVIERGHEGQRVRLFRSEGVSDPPAPFVDVTLAEVQPDCWFVVGVQRSPEESERYQEYEGASLSVRGREVQAYFADFQDGASAIVEIGYGGESTQHLWERGDEFAEFRLDFEPNGEGHYLILLRDENGDVFSAFGSPLPEGDFAAG